MKKEKHFLDTIKRFSIEETEFSHLPKNVQRVLSEYEDINFYEGKEIPDRAEEVKNLIKKYQQEIKKNKGSESHGECFYLQMITHLLDRMYAYEIRKLKLEKLLK